MKKDLLARVLNILETLWILLMLLNAYWLGYQFDVPPYLLVLPLALFVGNTWALLRTKNVVLFFVQIVALLLLFSGGVTYLLAVLCLAPVMFVPQFFPKKWLKPMATVVVIMAVALAGVSVYTLMTAAAPEVTIEQTLVLEDAKLELRHQTVTMEMGPNTLRGVYFEKQLLGCTFTRLLYVCTDEREITLSWQDDKTALINGRPCSVYFSRLIGE